MGADTIQDVIVETLTILWQMVVSCYRLSATVIYWFIDWYAIVADLQSTSQTP